MMAYRDQSSVRLQWLPPASDGGRLDLRYRIECVGCDNRVTYTPRQANLHGTALVHVIIVLIVITSEYVQSHLFVCPAINALT